MILDLQELKKRRKEYESQRTQHQQMFYQLNGAIALLDTQIKKLEDSENGEANDKATEEVTQE